MTVELIDLISLNKGLDETTKKLEADRDSAAKNGWFDKAAKLDDVIEGIRKAKFLANCGDHHAQNSGE